MRLCKSPLSYVVPEKENVKLADITDYMKDYLTDFMIPEYYVELKSLPLNANGKEYQNQHIGRRCVEDMLKLA